MSTTKNLGLFKHDNPSTNTDIFDVDKAINQNWDKTDEAIGQDRDRLDLLEASNTIYNFKGKVDTLANLQLKTKTEGYVWYCEEDSTYYTYTGTDWIPVNLNLKLGVIDELKAKTIKCLQEVETPTPVSGTSIDLSDSADAKIDELKISGNSKQETRSGKNLLPINVTDKTMYGITITKNSDGTYTLNGTATTSFTFDLYSGDYIKLPSGTYTGQSGQMLGFYIRKDSGDYQTLSETNKKTNTFTITEDFIYNRIYMFFFSGKTYNNTILTPMLVSGAYTEDTMPTYEQYGASPSPDYPSEVESCGDNVNIFDKDNYTNAFLNVNTGAIDSTSSWVSSWKITDYIEINSTILTLSFELLKNSTSTSWNIKFGFYDKDKNFISGIGEQIPSSKSYDVPVNTKYIKFNYAVVDYIEKIKIEKGKTATPSYSKYGQGCINEVVCNENLYSGAQQPTTSSVEIAKVKANTTYTFSIDCRTTASDTRLNLYINGERITILYIGTETLSYTFTPETDGDFSIRFSGGVSNATVNYIMFNHGGISEYIPHKSQTFSIPTQQPMRSVGDVRDTFVKINNKWYERHNVGRYIFNGTESFRDVAIGNEINYFSLGTALSDYYYIDDNTLNYICNYFKGIKTVNRYQDNTFFINAGKNIVMCTNSFTTTTEFKAWLAEQYNAGTPVYVDYILTTPNDIECTEEQSAILWNIEQNAKTYDKVTHMYSKDNVSSYKEVTYKKDIETLFANTLVEGV